VKAKTLLALSFLALFWSCSEKPFFEVYHQIEAEGWSADSVQGFTVDIDDTSTAYTVLFNLRANDLYPYSNLYLFRSIYSEEGLEYSDTANLKLADPYGKWLGEGVGELKTFQRLYRAEPIRFNNRGSYRFEFTQAMRQQILPGVKAVGLTIFKEENGKEESN
jgi:gliding motility-associated lipoprotein GldH